MSESDTNILDGSPVEITFAGETYQFKQKPRRKQRLVRRDLSEVGAVLGQIEETESNAQKMPLLIDFMNKLLGFCEDNNPDMARDIERIEAHIIASGIEGFTSLIEDVFTPLFKSWLEPYIPGADAAQKKMTTSI